VARPARREIEGEAGQFLVLGRIGSIGSVALRSVISDFKGLRIHIHGRSPPDGLFHRPLTRGGFDALGRFLIVSADLVCGLCSSAPSLDAAGWWSFWSGEMNRGVEVCSVIMSMVISFGYCSTILVWSDLPRRSFVVGLTLDWIGHRRI